MNFPEWVDKPKQKTKRAQNRLRYVMNTLANHATGRSSLRSLASHVGMNHSTLAIYIRNGKCSLACAKRLQDTFGKELAPFDFLIDPLNFKPEQ